MMRVPVVYTASEINQWHVSEEYAPGLWRPSRCCGFGTLSWDHIKMRFRIAWRVFTGRLDALNWEDHSGEKPATDIRYRDCRDHQWLRATKMCE